jgi:VWFA-related protein
MRALLLAVLLFQISETIEVHVAEVEVVVVDGAGKPVAGLTKDDFELRVDGKPRPISNFYAVNRGVVQRESLAAAAPNAPASAPELPLPAPPTHLVIFVDQERLDLAQRNRVLAALDKFAETHVKPGVDAALVVYNHGAKMRLQPTTDVARLRTAIAELKHESPRLMESLSERRRIIQVIDDAARFNGGHGTGGVDEVKHRVLDYGEHRISELRQSLDAIEFILGRLRGASGRKVFVHVSSGLPLQPAVEVYDYFERKLFVPLTVDKLALQQITAYETLVKAAQAAGAALYTIDASGLTGDEGTNLTTTGPIHLDTKLIRDNLHGPLQLLADETGGKAILDENDFDRAFSEIEAQYTTYYSIGFRADSDKKPHKVDVRVKRAGLAVRSAKGYQDRDAEERTRDAIESAFDFPPSQNPLGVEVRFGRIEGGGAVPIRVTVAPKSLVVLPDGTARRARVRAYFQMRNADGGTSPLRIVDEELDVAGDDAPVVLRKVAGMKLHPGKYTLSMAVRDLTSNDTSYVVRAIEVPAAPALR